MYKYIEPYHQFIKTRLSPANYESEKYIIPELVKYLSSDSVQSWHEVRRSNLEAWLTYLTRVKKNSVRSRVRKVTSVRRFFNWLVEEGYLLTAPIDEEFYRPKITKHLRRSPSPTEALKALDNADQSLRLPYRNRAIMELTYGTGLRRAELRSLNVKDAEGSELRVIGKGNKERLVPLGDNARKHLLLYIRTERLRIVSRFNPLEEALFVGQYGRRLCLGAFNSILKYQVKSPYSLHSFRHACATHMLHNGANIRAVQKLLGHEKLSTTQDYTHLETGHIKDMLSKFHPRG